MNWTRRRVLGTAYVAVVLGLATISVSVDALWAYLTVLVLTLPFGILILTLLFFAGALVSLLPGVSDTGPAWVYLLAYLPLVAVVALADLVVFGALASVLQTRREARRVNSDDCVASGGLPTTE